MISWEKYPHKVGVCLKGQKKKKTECLHVGTVLFVGSVFVGAEILFACRVGLFEIELEKVVWEVL